MADIARKYHISSTNVSHYVRMTPAEIERFGAGREKAARKYRNIIYKMMSDEHSDTVIFSYLRSVDPEISARLLVEMIQLISRNHFPFRKTIPACRIYRTKQTNRMKDGTVILSRKAVLKALFTIDPKKREKQDVFPFIDSIREKYPKAAWAQDVFLEFHGAVMGGTVSAMDAFIAAHADSPELGSFCDGLLEDYEAVCNGITSPMSSGFVEGSNCKFKFIKRMMYGRAELPFLSTKSILAFAVTRGMVDPETMIRYRSRNDYIAEQCITA